MTAAEIVSVLIARRYGERAWACLREVGDSTGFACKRHVDLVAIGLWPSRGMEIHGVEVKGSKSDWRHELKQPEKAEEGFRRWCDKWYVATPPGIVDLAELPPGWGLLEVETKKVQEVRAADKIEALPWGRAQVAAVARRLVEQTAPEAVLAAVKTEARQEAWADALESANSKVRHDLAELKELKETVRRFEKASGVDLGNRWRAGEIGDVVKAVMHGSAQIALENARLRLLEVQKHIGVALQLTGEPT